MSWEVWINRGHGFVFAGITETNWSFASVYWQRRARILGVKVELRRKEIK
jgi:hypothetical protein